MKQPTRTLPQALKEFPKSWKEVFFNNIPENFYNLPYEEKIKCIGNTRQTYYCSFKNNKLFFGLKSIIIKRIGRKFYPEHSWTNIIVIENNKVETSKLDHNGVKRFLSIVGLNLPFLSDKNLSAKLLSFITRSYVIADILRKKVYSEETLCRCILSKGYHLKGFDWKLFYKYIECESSDFISIFDLKDFTKDLAKSMQTLINRNPYIYDNTYSDLLKCAVKLNEIVDFTWSEKRIQIEHQRQITELNRIEIDKKEQVPIYDVCLDEPNIHMLNTEKEVFIEGTSMHHCLYNCYWNKIQSKNHIAFHMTKPEVCTFSFEIKDDKVTLNQAFLAYDKRISDSTREVILDFMNRNKSDLYRLLTNKVLCEWPFDEDDNRDVVEPVPFPF